MLKKICKEYDKFTLCKLCHEIFGNSGGLVDVFSNGNRVPLEGTELNRLPEISKCDLPSRFVGFCKRLLHSKGVCV